MVVLGVRVVVALAALAVRVGRSMVCLRREDPEVSAASSSASAASPVSNEDIFDVTEDTRLLDFSPLSLAVDCVVPRRDDMP